MPTADKPSRQFYTEEEAALLIGVSLTRLRLLLDQHIFNDGSERPGKLLLQSSDLVLLRFSHSSTPNPKVIRMPRR